MWIFNVLCLGISCAVTFRKIAIIGQGPEITSETFHNCFALLNCATLFLTVRWFSHTVRLPEAAQRLIVSVGRKTFGIYLFHGLFMGVRIPFFGRIWAYLHETLPLNQMLITFCVCGIIMLIGYWITWLLQKIPGIRWLVT